MRTGITRLSALVTAFLLLISILPHSAGAQTVLQPVTEEAELVSGSYVLLSSEGYAPGNLDTGWLQGLQPQMEEGLPVVTTQMVWNLDVSQEGVQLTDSAGNTIAPAESEEMGLIPGAYRWQVSFEGGRFSFHGMAGETAVTLARCDDLGFRGYDSRLMGTLLDGSFALYRLTETEPEDPPENPEDPPEDPDDPPENPEDPPVDPDDPPEDPEDPPEEPETPAGPGLFSGQLHSHTAHSGAAGTPAEAYAYAKETAGLDFLAITDHSDSFDGSENGVLSQDAAEISPQWKLGREAAAEATTGNFLALYGFEMTWQNGLGHISTFFTPGFQSRNQDAYTTYATALQNYYQALATVPGSVRQKT